MPYQTLFERLELKYLVTEPTARAIACAIRPYCEPDAYNGRAGLGYLVRSLYLDSPTLACFRAKERGDHDRLKLRARTYDDTGPVNLEIKRKRGDVVWKERASVARAEWEEAAQGWAAIQGRHARTLERFSRLASELAAEPKVLIDYEREAYASHADGYARVTFDRSIRALPEEGWTFTSSAPLEPVMIEDEGTSSSPIVLELKCEQFVPPWMVELVHDFQLRRVGFSKYNTAMRAVLDPNVAARALLWEATYA